MVNNPEIRKRLLLACKALTAWEGGAMVWPSEPCSTAGQRSKLGMRIKQYLKYNDIPIPPHWRRIGRPRRLL